MDLLGFFFILLGTLSFALSAIGLLRMPDIYSRMHVAAKAPTMATLFVMIGAFLIEPTWGVKLILLVALVLLTNPLSASVVARASHAIGTEHLNPNGIDELKESIEES